MRGDSTPPHHPLALAAYAGSNLDQPTHAVAGQTHAPDQGFDVEPLASEPAVDITPPADHAVPPPAPTAPGTVAVDSGHVLTEVAECEPCAPDGVADQSHDLESLINFIMYPRSPNVKRVLHLFSGKTPREPSLGHAIRALGHQCVEVDLLNGLHHDLTATALGDAIVAALRAGLYDAVFMGTPCNTFSVARMRRDGGPAQLRSLWHPHGMPWLRYWDRRAVALSDALVSTTVRVARAAAANGVCWAIENPPSRSYGSEMFQVRYCSHLSLWDLEVVKALVSDLHAGTVTFHQCAFGGEYAKWTQLAFSESLSGFLSSWRAYRCTHGFAGHDKVAIGDDSAPSASYPNAMTWALAQALLLVEQQLTLFSAPSFRSGSAMPHAADALAAAAVEEARAAGSASLRRLEPERDDVLIRERFPSVNVPVRSEYQAPPEETRDTPPSLTTDQLIPERMLQSLRTHRTRVAACYEAASRGRWRWAKDHRPPPLAASEDECLQPGVPRGWSWQKRPGADLWDPVLPSSWPHSPPDADLDAAAILEYAAAHDFPDMGVIAWMCDGYPGPDMQHHTLIGTPHVGALRDFVALKKCALKDREKGWGTYGHLLPPVWPTLCDPVNIVWRHGKPRMTIDKTMQLHPDYAAYNACIHLDREPTIDYVSAALAGRSTAILLTAGVRVSLWGLDVDAYFRKSGKQRAHWWMSGLLYFDGYGHDPRVQFGQREAPVRLGRQSTFIRFAVFNELQRLDAAYPSRATGVAEWLRGRAMTAVETSSSPDEYAVLFYVMIFVDDVAGGSIDDELFDRLGRPVTELVDGVVVPVTRATMHYRACIGVLEQFGHKDAAGKGVPPAPQRVFLGVTECVDTRTLYLTPEKRRAYSLLCEAVVDGPRASRGGTIVPFEDLNSLMHKLLHAASLIVLGRQHLFHVKKALHMRTNLRCGSCLLHEPALTELRWWIHRLSDSADEGVPIASRSLFPQSGDPSVVDSYSDASRELDSASSSGAGAWCIMGGTFCYVERRWTEHERYSYSINVLEYAAMNMALFSFASEARRLGLPVTHYREHVDNTAAEHVSERGRPHTAEMHALTQYRYTRMREEQIVSASFRVASVDNDVADGLSRGGQKMADALRMAVQAGLIVRRLEIDPTAGDLAKLLG